MNRESLALRRRSPRLTYGFAVLLVVLCFVWAYSAPRVEFELTILWFVVPVLVSAWFGGRGPGLLAIALSLAAGRILMPLEESASGLRGDYLDLLSFALEAVLVVALVGALREAREEADASSRSKELFMAVVSHELRTPLMVMVGWVSQLRRVPGDSALANRAHAALERTARTLTRLIEDLTDVSRARSGKLALERERLALMPLVASAVEDVRTAAAAKRVVLAANIGADASEVVVDGDPVRLAQLFSNLLTNAVKFTPEGGRIEVDARDAGDCVVVRVTDTGPGIPETALPFIFDPFRQVNDGRDRAAGGLGLGLAIAKHVVELHGGRISVETARADRGTTFVVELPRAASAIANEQLRESLVVQH
jgi:signal transduction histidine kinase